MALGRARKAGDRSLGTSSLVPLPPLFQHNWLVLNMIKKCLFPAAGYGTRFLPATKSMPKEMMPVVNKPLIEYGVEEAIEAGMNGMCIVTGRGNAYFGDCDRSFPLFFKQVVVFFTI